MLRRLTLRCGSAVWLAKNVTVTRAHNQLRSINSDLNRASLAGLRRLLRIVTNAVLAAQLFRHQLECGGKILLFGIVESRAGHACEIVEILIAAFVFRARAARPAASATRPATAAATTSAASEDAAKNVVPDAPARSPIRITSATRISATATGISTATTTGITTTAAAA